MKNSDEEVERILGVPDGMDEGEYIKMINSDIAGGKEGQIRFKDGNSIGTNSGSLGSKGSNMYSGIQNGKPFDILGSGNNGMSNRRNSPMGNSPMNNMNSLEEILGLEMKGRMDSKKTTFDVDELLHAVNSTEQGSNRDLFNFGEFNNYKSPAEGRAKIEQVLERQPMNSYQRKMFKNAPGSDSSLYLQARTGYLSQDNVSSNCNSNNGSNGSGHYFNEGDNNEISGYDSYSNTPMPYRAYEMDNRKRHAPGNANGNYMFYSDIKKPMAREPATDPLLFRHPVFSQSSFNPNAYNRVKRRRRLNTNTWNSTGGAIVSPSKLSSIDYVFGNMNPDSKNSEDMGVDLASPGRSGLENARTTEMFKKKINAIDFDNVTVFELKTLMKDFGVNPSGKKQEMIDRLQQKLKELGDTGKSKVPFVKPKDSVSFDGFFF